MEQRPLRLGDIVDDYCPRERRITNHAIVAIVEEAIRQTRCATCDTEHVYKDGREPRRRKKEPEAVLTGPGTADAVERPAGPARADAHAEAGAPHLHRTAPSVDAAFVAEPEEANAATAADDGWPANRQLIRATLPKTDNDPPVPRPIPEFTMHQRPGRSQGFRYTHGWGGQGNGPARGGGFRPGRPPSEHGRGPEANGNGNGNGTGRPPGAGRSGRRRGRPKPPR